MKKSTQEIVRRTRGRDTAIDYTLASNVENLTLTYLDDIRERVGEAANDGKWRVVA